MRSRPLDPRCGPLRRSQTERARCRARWSSRMRILQSLRPWSTNWKLAMTSNPSAPMPNKKNRSVLAIDPGYDRVGIAVMRGEKLTMSECLVPTTKEFSERLKQIYQRITTVIHEHRPDAIAIETIFMTRNQKTAIKVAEARGVAILAAANAGLPLFEY